MHLLKYSQKVPISMQKCWDFFSKPSNLKVITPEYLSFHMTCEECEMYPGQMITYTIKPILNIPLKWVTEITHVEKYHYFIDEQRIGPYRLWHHEHHFIPIPEGVEMRDALYYQLPFGPIGKLVNALKVRKDIEGIFSYRRAKMIEMFGEVFSED